MGYKCPYCGEVTPDEISSYSDNGDIYFHEESYPRKGHLFWSMKKCAMCKKLSFSIFGGDSDWGTNVYLSYPPDNVKAFPDYVPEAVRIDYMEARTILQQSPKAAATLARRCLQGMIHDFWDIHEKNLNAEITSLKGKIPSLQWKAIDSLRKIGNIGAHMESDVDRIIDVDPQEADKLLTLIEFLVDKWYIARHDEEAFLQEVVEIGDQKEAERKG